MKTVTVSLKDWKAIKKFFREQLRTYQFSYGLPGKLRTTWRKELAETVGVEELRTIEAAEKAIARGRSSSKR